MDLKETDILGEDIGDHWYYRSKAAATLKLLGAAEPSVILDVGAGSGFFSRYLLQHTDAAESWCVDICYAADSDETEAGKRIHFRRSLEATDADLVLLMDVLEHVEDDVGLLTDYARKVPRGARFLISVPAFQFLWSSHDDFLEHKRRYRIDQLEAVVQRAGLSVEHSCYYFGLVFPIAATARLSGKWLGRKSNTAKSQLKQHSPATNAILALLCRAELPLLAMNRLVGLTAFCLARKQ